MIKDTNRFEITYKQGKIEGVQIMVDKETGVNYLVYFSGYGSSVTPLLDADGKPVVTLV